MALVGFLSTACPLNWKGRQNGTLIVTNDRVGFFPVDPLGRMRPFPYSAIISVEARSFLGHRTVTFHTQEGPLKVRCLASKQDLANLFEFVNNRIAADAGKERLAARHTLTEFKVSTGDVAEDRQWDDQYQEALRQLFHDAEHQELEMVRISALGLPDLPEFSPGGRLEQTEAFGHVKSLGAESRRYGAATQTMFRSGQGQSGTQAIPATVRVGNKKRRDGRAAVLLVVFVAVELWWLHGMQADVAWPVQAQQQQAEYPPPNVPRKPDRNRNTARNWQWQEISRPQPDKAYARPAGSFGSSNATQIAAERPDKSGAAQDWTTSSHDALLPQLMDDKNYRLLASLIRQQRNAVGMTQMAVARAMGWNSALIAEVEDGTYRIDLIELIELSEVIQLDINAALDQLHQMGDQ